MLPPAKTFIDNNIRLYSIFVDYAHAFFSPLWTLAPPFFNERSRFFCLIAFISHYSSFHFLNALVNRAIQKFFSLSLFFHHFLNQKTLRNKYFWPFRNYYFLRNFHLLFQTTLIMVFLFDIGLKDLNFLLLKLIESDFVRIYDLVVVRILVEKLEA